MASNAHTLHARCHHHGWDNALPPAVRIAPGDTVTFETVDASGGQLGPAATLDDLRRLDFALVNPVTGPVHVDGAEPGDALKGSGRGVRAVRLGMDGKHPRLRAARGPVSGVGAAPLVV